MQRRAGRLLILRRRTCRIDAARRPRNGRSTLAGGVVLLRLEVWHGVELWHDKFGCVWLWQFRVRCSVARGARGARRAVEVAAREPRGGVAAGRGGRGLGEAARPRLRARRHLGQQLTVVKRIHRHVREVPRRVAQLLGLREVSNVACHLHARRCVSPRSGGAVHQTITALTLSGMLRGVAGAPLFATAEDDIQAAQRRTRSSSVSAASRWLVSSASTSRLVNWSCCVTALAREFESTSIMAR